jgi:MFS family permease
MTTLSHDAALGQKPTRVRFGVLAFAATLSMITYLDRVCIGSAAKELVKDLGLNSVADLAGVLAAFSLAYALFEVPTGWLADIWGPRRVMIRIVIWWSCFTALTGLIGWHVGGYVLGTVEIKIGWYVFDTLALLTLVRFLFGIGEAGAYPNITRALHNWFPFEERGFAQGTVWMSARLMGGLTPLVWALLVTGINYEQASPSGQTTTVWLWYPLVHWRATFWLFAGLGLVWCALFMLWFRDRPEEKSSVNAAELALIRSGAVAAPTSHGHVPWRQIFTSGNLWTLCIMYACQSYPWYFYVNYLPNFLEQQYHVSPTSFWGALCKGGPLWMGAIGCLAGGFLTDWFIRRTGNRRLGRRLFGVLGHGACVFGFLGCLMAPDVAWFFIAISLCGFSADLTMGSSWSICQDIGRRHSAIVAGSMNMIGNLGGFFGTWFSGWILGRALNAHAEQLGMAVNALSEADKAAGLWPGYQLNFMLFVICHVIGVICWLRVDSTKPVAAE